MYKNIKLPLIKEFLIELTNNNYSLETIKNYERDLYIFSEFLKDQNIKFKKLTKATISIYKGFLKSKKYLQIFNDFQENGRNDGDISKSRSKGSRTYEKANSRLSSRSINRMLSSLRAYLKFLIDFDYKSPIPPDAVKLVKLERKESHVAEFEDLVRLVEFPSKFEKVKYVAKRNRAILELLFSTGMRISELVALNIEDIDLVNDKSDIRQNKIFITGKGKKQRFVYLTQRCKKYLIEYLKLRNDSFTALFVPTRGVRLSKKDKNKNEVRISARYIQNRIAKYRRLLGIVVPTTPHSLRHGFATYLAEKGASPVAIQRLLGHESLQTTTRYVHASDKFAQESHEKYHPLK